MKYVFPLALFFFGTVPFAEGATAVTPTPAPFQLQAKPALSLRDGGEAGLKFTLKEAENYALANHPQIAAANLTAEAVRQQIREARSAFFPQLTGESDSVFARDGYTRLAAGTGLNNPSVYSRQSDGLVLSQLITDFGRTYELTESAHFRADAAGDRANVARAIVVLAVDRAYFDVLRSNAVMRVANETVSARDLAFRQVSALSRTGLKSTVDVDFAEVNLSDAEMLQIQAKSSISLAEADLSTALGFSDAQHFTLSEEPMGAGLASSPDGLIQEALNKRPELANLHNEMEAAQRLAKAQDASRYPTVTALGAAGVNPISPHNEFKDTYYAAGVNVELPILAGGRLDAKAEEAHLLASAAVQNVIDAQNTITRDVRAAWLAAETAHERIGVGERMVQAAGDAQKLATSRYQLGTSSIVELTQAQLNYTEAELQATSARYDYQTGRSLLNFTTGSSF